MGIGRTGFSVGNPRIVNASAFASFWSWICRVRGAGVGVLCDRGPDPEKNGE